MAGFIDDAGSRQGEGDGDPSHPVWRGFSKQGVGTVGNQEKAREKFCPETSVPGTVFKFIFTVILSRVVSQSSGSGEQSQMQS